MNPGIVFVLITVTLDAMGIGLILPVMPDLIREVSGGDIARAALWGGVLSTVFAVMQFFFSPLLGNLSDRYGRRPVLLISLVVMAADYVVMALAGSIWLLLVARIIGGITAATHATATAYIADISPPEKKSSRFGLIGAGFGLGFVLGPVVGGLLAEFGTRAPFYAAAVLAGLNVVFGLLVMRETVTDAMRRPFEWRRANPFGAVEQIRKLPGILPLVVTYFIYSVAIYVYPAVWAYYTRDRFDWSPQTIGMSLALYGVATAIVQGGLIRIILRHLGDRMTVVAGHVFEIIIFLLIAAVSNPRAALVITPLAALGGVITPALTGIMSKRVEDNAQGELQGVLASANALAMIVSPLLMTGIFAAFTGQDAPAYIPGAPFLLAMVLMIGGLWLFLRTRDLSA